MPAAPFLRRRSLVIVMVQALVLAGSAHAQQKPATQAAAPPATAQPARPAAAPAQPGAPNAAGGSGPITIDADRLEVLDKDKRAIFTGNVVAVRGDMTVRSSAMTVFYDGDLAGGQGQVKPSAAPSGSNQSVRRIEMTGKVFFNQRDQQATGDNAVYERATETLVLTGNVVLTQCQNVVTGPRLVVNLRTNQAQVEGAPGSRVRSIIVPGDNQPQGGAPAAGAQPPCGPAPGSPAAASPPPASAAPAQPGQAPAVKRKS